MNAQQLLTALKNAEQNLYKSVRNGLVEEAEEIMSRSQNEFVPELTGNLKDSGQVTVVEDGTIDGLQIVLSYGDEKTADYAVTVHETPSGFDPPTWEGKEVQFTKGGPKYLEKPLFEAENGLIDRIAGKIRL